MLGSMNPQGLVGGTDFHAVLALIDVLRDPAGAGKLLLELAEAKAASEFAAQKANEAATRAHDERVAADRRIAELKALELRLDATQAEIDAWKRDARASLSHFG